MVESKPMFSGNTYTFTKSFSRPTLNNSVNNTITLTVTDNAGNSSTDSCFYYYYSY